MIVDIIFLGLSILGFWYGAQWVVDSASAIARRIGVSELVIGLTIVAIGTSAPEFGVSTIAALKGYPDLAVANVVGSNTFNLGFILGSLAIIHQIEIGKKLVYRDGFVLMSIIFLIVFLFRDLILTRIEGALLFSLLFFYIGYLYWKREEVIVEENQDQVVKSTRGVILPLVAGLGLIAFCAHLLVGSARNIALALGIPEWVIGVTIVGAGTSSPELVVSVIAVLKRRYELSIGNLIGSDIFNMTGVLGLAGILTPLQIVEGAAVSLYMLVGMNILVILLMRTDWRLTRVEGCILVLLAIMRWIGEIKII